MTTLTFLIVFVVLVGVGFYFVERSKERSARNTKRSWQPDVDGQKSETMANLQSPPDR
ncbi:hypothetical protein HEP89_12030 [Labrenzia sp. 5N]|uniref:hypothetical protein n=1 Tax=Labrenzia sp. 5N TaxID=2723402 RepID=UPI001444D5D2|nr:hypothetical protein [Labrenzia sp. 5N]NKX64841.1 hypothetical protein [Labrenzia sp. 5N]